MKSISIISLLFFSLHSFAEYRAYQYLIKDPIHPSVAPRIVTTSQNPITYRTYSGNSLNITLLNTWMCPGNTAQKKICPYPFSPSPDEIKLIGEQQ